MLTTEQMVDTIADMTVNDLCGLTKALEDRFDVKAYTGQPVLPGDALQPSEELEEKTEFDVVIKDVGAEKIQVIKAVRAITALGLKEAKDLAVAGSTIIEAASEEDAQAAKAQLEKAGATIEIK